MESSEANWEVIIAGGGAAGLSAALVLGRARRRTLVVDAGGQSNLAAEGIGGLLGHDGKPPSQLYGEGKAELAKYPAVEVRSGTVAGGSRNEGGFALALDDGSTIQSRAVLIATGMDYRFPEVPGGAERWGRTVFHCPFCHGWEVRDQPLGVLGEGEEGVARSLLLSAWSDDVTLFTDGAALGADETERLAAAGVAVEERGIAGLRGGAPALEAIELEGGEERPLGGLLVPPRLHQRSDLAVQLGAELADPTPLQADAVKVDGIYRTNVPGLSAAGDVVPGAPSVAAAIASGGMAAGGIVHGLVVAGR